MKKEKEAPPAEIREPKRSKNERAEAYLSKWYDFRFNTVKCKPEYRAKDGTMPYVPITKFTLNSLKRELDRKLGLTTSADNIQAILESDFSPKVTMINPMDNRI